MANLSIKSGDTFSALCQRVDENGEPISISGVTVTSSVRNISGSFSQALTVAVVDAAIGQFSISATATSTNTWPISTSIDGTVTPRNFLFCDVQYTSGFTVQSSETLIIQVFEDVT
jgi:hypothetical protein